VIEERRLKVSQVLCQRIREKELAERERASERARESERESARARERVAREMSQKTTATYKYRIQTLATLKKKKLTDYEKADACKESVTKAL
jgi:hypothetical protein